MAKSGKDTWGEWETVSKGDGVTLDARKNLRTGIVETRVVATIAASTERIWKLLTTPDSYMKVMPKTIESIHLGEKPRSKQLHCYQRLSSSGTSDRDYTLKVSWEVEERPEGKRYRRQWSVDNGKGPEPKQDVVRIEKSDGTWILEPLAGKKTEFTQQSYIELGGSLWTVLANTAVKEAAREIVASLRREIGS